MHVPSPCYTCPPCHTGPARHASPRGQNDTRLYEPYLSETTVADAYIDITSGFRRIWSEVLPLRCSSSPRGSTPSGSPSRPHGTLNLRSPRCICVCRRKINGTFIPVIYLVLLSTASMPVSIATVSWRSCFMSLATPQRQCTWPPGKIHLICPLEPVQRELLDVNYLLCNILYCSQRPYSYSVNIVWTEKFIDGLCTYFLLLHGLNSSRNEP